MTKREKVIKGLEICTSKPCYCTDCPYKVTCYLDSQEVMEDALALLKEWEELEKRYEPNIMPLTNVMEWMGKSNELREPIYWENRFEKCENQWLLKPENPLYMINAIKAGRARAWTQKPTEEQSKAVKWE